MVRIPPLRRSQLLLLGAIIATAVAAAGCGGGDAPVVDGRTLAEWVEASRSSDQALRTKAYVALRSFGNDAAAREALAAGLADPKVPPRDKYVAAQSLFRITGSADGVVEPVRAAVQAQFGRRPPADPETKELEDLVFWLGARAAPLVPTLRQLRSGLGGNDPAVTRARLGLGRAIDAIPPQQ